MALYRLAHTIGRVSRSLTRPPDSLYERNARNVMIDGMGVGLAVGVGSFLSVFLIRLGASNFQVGLLTAMPAVTGALLAVWIGDFIQRQPNLILWYARSRIWVLSSYALTGIVPFLFGIDERATIAIIAIWALATLPQTMVNITFTLVMGAVAGPDNRLALMSRRWATLGITNALSVALTGWVLSWIAFPINYQVVFIGSFIGGLISYYFSTSITLPPGSHVVETKPAAWHAMYLGMPRLLRAQPAFARFIVSQFVYRCGFTMAIPLFPLYWVRVVNANESQVGLINTVGSAVLLVAYGLWSTVARQRGGRFALLVCGVGITLYPLLLGFSSQVWQLILLAGLAGIFAAGADLVLFDLLVATIDPDKRGPSVGLYHMTTFVATFVGPIAATAAADLWGIGTMLFVAAFVRAIGTLLFFFLGVGHESDTAAARAPSSA